MLVRAIVLAGFAASLSGGLVAFALLGVLAPSAVLFSFDQGTCKVLHASQRPCDCQAQRDPPCLTCQDLEMQVQPPASPAYEIFVTAHGTSFVNGTTYPCIIDPADPTVRCPALSRHVALATPHRISCRTLSSSGASTGPASSHPC